MEETKTSDTAGDRASGSIVDAVIHANGIDPDIVGVIANLTPERRAEIEKRVKLKIDCVLFPMLLIFYILNYLVRLCMSGFR